MYRVISLSLLQRVLLGGGRLGRDRVPAIVTPDAGKPYGANYPTSRLKGGYRITREVWATACEVWATACEVWARGVHMDRASPAAALKSRTTFL